MDIQPNAQEKKFKLTPLSPKDFELAPVTAEAFLPENIGGLPPEETGIDEVVALKQNALQTKQSLLTARQKLEEDYLRQYKPPRMSYMQPGGQGTYNFESPDQSDAFYKLQDSREKLDLAVRYLDRALNTPEAKKGAGKAAFQNELHNIISAGISGMLEDLTTARAAKQLTKGQIDDVNKSLVNAYGQLDNLNAIANKEVPRYRRASGIAGSLPYMEQFLLTGGVGTTAGGVASSAAQTITKGIASKAVKGLARRAIQYPLEGAISMIGRVPLSPATYGNIAQESIGQLKEVDGQYYVDPKVTPSIGQAIAKGTYNSAKEIFSESLGGMINVPTSLFPHALNKAISPTVKQFFKMVGMNNPQGEYFEEMISQALGGENSLDPEFLKDLAVTIPVITGGFSALSLPSVASQMKINYDKKKIVDTYGWDTINEVYDLVQSGSDQGIGEYLYERSLPGSWKDFDNLIKYAASLVQEKAAEEMANQPDPVDVLMKDESDPDAPIKAEINQYGEKLKFNSNIPLVQDQNPLISLASHKIEDKKFFLTGESRALGDHVYTGYNYDALQEAGYDFSQVRPQLIKASDIRERMDIPYQEWLQQEVNQFKQTQVQGQQMVVKAQAPVMEGQEVQLGDKTFNVTFVDENGITLNEIAKDGTVTGGELIVPPEDYEKVFGVPAAQSGQISPLNGQISPENVTEQGQVISDQGTNTGQPVENIPDQVQLPVNKKGEIEYDQITEPETYAQGLTQEFGEEAPAILDELIAEQTTALEKAKKGSNAIERARKVKAINAELKKLSRVKEILTPTAIAEGQSLEAPSASPVVEQPELETQATDQELARPEKEEVPEIPVTSKRNQTEANGSEQKEAQDKYRVDKNYKPTKGAFYLRFTENPDDDVKHKYSRWYMDDQEYETVRDSGLIEGKDYFKDEDSGEYYKLHTGLSGHALASESLTDAIKEVEAKKWWFRNSQEDNWSIFESDDNIDVEQDTPEGNTFAPYQVVFERNFGKRTEAQQPATEKSPEVELTKANAEVDIRPTEAQKEAENYKMGHVRIKGLDITIQNPVGSVRKGTDKNGNEWAIILNNTYGYIRGTVSPEGKGKKKDQVDVFLGDNLDSDSVYVIDQIDPDSGKWDEHKVMIGFNSAQDAKDNYLANYEPGWKGLGDVTKMSIENFKEWVFDKEATQKPLAYKEVTDEQRGDQKTGQKADNTASQTEEDTTTGSDQAGTEGAGEPEFAGETLENTPRTRSLREFAKDDIDKLNDLFEDKPEETPDSKQYQYKMNARPFDIGTYPKEGFVKAEDDPRGGFQILTYSRKLTEKERNHWSFLPLTEVDDLEGKQFEDQDGEYFVDLEWMPNYSGADVSMFDSKNQLVEKPYFMSTNEILKNIEFGYWREKKEVEKPKETTKDDIDRINDLFGEKPKAEQKSPYSPIQQKQIDKINKEYSELIAKKEDAIVQAEKEMREALLKSDNRNGLFGDTNPVEKDEIIKRDEQGFSYSEATRAAVRKPFEEKMTELRKEIAELTLEQKGKIESVIKQQDLFADTPVEPAESKPIDKESLPKLEDFGQKIGGARKDMEIVRKERDTDSLPAWRRKYHYANADGTLDLVVPVDTSKPFIVQWAKNINSWAGKRTVYRPVTTIDTRETKIFNSEEEAEAYIPIYEVWKQNFRVRKSGDNYVIAKTSSTNKIIEYGTFPTEEEANTYMYSTEGATSLLNHKREDFSIPALDKVERTGKDWRKGKDISTEEFMNTFGFRGGEFGNWVKPEERRIMLNAAYDSFMDMTELLNVPPKALSLGGELSIAFGARGVKGAAAHFEPDRAVINLTRMNGAGALAHEWSHALDNYFGLQAAKKDYSRNDKGEVIAGKVMRTTSSLLSVRGMRKELSEIFDKVIEATQEKSVTRKMGIEEKQKYFDKFQKSVQREATDLIKKFTNGARRYQYNRKTKQREDVVIKATPDQIKKAKSIVDKIIAGEGTKPIWERIPGSKGMGKYSYISPETLALEELHKVVFGKTGLDRDGNGFYNLGYYGDKMYQAKETLDKAKAGESETLKVPTDFLKTSREFDKSRATPYWSTKIEMFARAFEYFIETKLLNQNARADYLQYDKAPVYDAVYGKNPYPQGEERAEINKLFQQFFDEVKVKTDENDVSLLYENEEDYVRDQLDGYENESQKQKAVKEAVNRTQGRNIDSGLRSKESLYPKVLPRTVLEGFKESGYVDVIGQKIESPQDIADLWSIHRSPHIEKAHIIFVKEGRIVGSTASTVNHIGFTLLPTPDDVIELYNKFGADGVYYLHNHPSGNNKPSVGDVLLTKNHGVYLAERGINLLGHVIVDTNKFSFIDVKSNPPTDFQYRDEVADYINEYVREYEYKNPVPRLFSERETLVDTGQKRLIEISKALLTENGYKGAIIYLSSNLEISAYDVFPEGATAEDVVRIAQEGLNNHLGSQVAFVHDGSYSRQFNLASPLPTDVLDVIDTDKMTAEWFSKKDQETNYVKQILWEGQSEYESEFAGEFLERAQDITQTPAFKKWFGKSKGVDEMQTKEEDGRTMMFRTSNNTYYSPIEKALKSIKQNKATVKQWKAMILNNGAKPAELEWMGWDEAIEQGKPDQSLTKDELQMWIDQSKVDIHEVERSDEKVMEKLDELNKQLNEAKDEYDRISSELGGRLFYAGSPLRWVYKAPSGNIVDVPEEHLAALEYYAEKKQAYEEYAESLDDPMRAGNGTKYRQYTLPGGKNYRELLLTMPSKSYALTELSDAEIIQREKEKGIRVEEKNGRLYVYDDIYQDPFIGSYGNEKELANSIRQGYEGNLTRELRKEGEYHTRHWDEPNVLLHVRLNSRITPDGKNVLFIEEIQSDWAQQGKKKGFWGVFDQQRFEKWYKENKHSTDPTWEEYQKLPTKEKKEYRDAFTDEMDEMGFVPNMPFKKTDQWAGLAIRRMIRYAIDEGYDTIAWTPGEIQNERYDLSKQLDEISVNKTSDALGEGYIVRTFKNGNLIFTRGVFNNQELEELIGKDLAQKVIDDEIPSGSAKIYSGVDLKVGGKGMIGFYDEILPSIANKIGKKFGAKVEPLIVVGDEESRLALRYQDIKKRLSEIESRENELIKLIGENQGEEIGTKLADEYNSYNNEKNDLRQEGSDLERRVSPKVLYKQTYSNAVHSLPITNSMFESFREGVPYFRIVDNPIADIPDGVDQAERESEVKDKIKALSKELNTPVVIVKSRTDLPQTIQADAKRKGLFGNEYIYGVWNAPTGTMYIIMDDVMRQGPQRGLIEATRTILHEAVAHKGLPAMLGEEAYNEFLDELYDSIPADDISQIKYKYDTKDKRTIAAEYLAMMAEDNVNPSLFQRVAAMIRRLLRRVFSLDYSEDDVYDMLRRSVENLRKQKRENAEFAGEYLEGADNPNILEEPNILSNADQRYNTPIEKRTLKEKLDELRRGLKDVHLPIRRFEEAIKKLGGVMDDRSKPYRDINLAFERLDYLYNQFMKNKFNPINKAVAAIRKSGVPAGEVLPYIIAKRATELNPKMRQKEIDEWITSRNERDEAKRKAFIKANPKISAERMTKYELKLLEDMEEDKSKFIDSVKDKDYSGVMPFDYDKNGQPRGNYTNPEELAKDIVAEFEKKAGNDLTDNLWKSIREATGEILNIWERGSQLSPEDKAEYEKSQYYVPLRGWRFGAAKSLVYTRGEGFSKSLKHAEGRSSLADNPLAYIEKIAFTAIQEQVSNEVNNSMANLIIKNLNVSGVFNMAVLKKVYYVKQPDGTTMYTIDRPPEDMFTRKLAEAKTYTEHENLRPKSAALEHEVTIVRRPGGDLALVFKDEYLQVSQALNRQNYMLQLLSDKVIDTRTKGRMLSLMSKATNILKANLTQWNVVFPFTNHLRDSQEGPVTQYIKHGNPGLKTLGKYPSAYGALFRYIFTKPDLSKQTDRDVVDFYENGGATGYTHGRTVEDIEKQIEKDVSGMIHRGVIGKTLVDPVKTLLSGISFWNQFFEDASRLAVYRAAISMGMSKKDAAYESKEATINMNRKGLLSKQFDAWTAFFNVALEGTNKNVNLAKHYPRRFAIVATGYIMLGYLNNLLWSMLGDDDDDLQYKNISPYMRQNYLTIPNPVAFFTGNKSNRYVSIPLAQFWRAFFAAGNISYDVMTGRMKAGEAFLYAGADMVNAVSPIDVGGFWVKGEFSIAPLVPTITRPMVEIYQNRDFLGNTIYKKPFTRALENYYADAGLGKKNANPAAKMLTDFLYATLGGGDKETYLEYRTNKRGDDKKIIELLDWNPSKIEHIFKGYLGGTGGFVSDLITTVAQGIGEENIDFKNIPFVNKFVRTIPEAKWAVIDQYYSNSDVFKRNEFSEGSAEKIADTTGDYENLSKIQTNEYRMEFQAIMSYYSKQITDTYKDYDFDYEAGNKMAVDLMTMANEEVSALKAKYGKK